MREPYIGNPYTRIPTTSRDDMVSVETVRGHIESLLSMGMTPMMLTRAAGLATSSIQRILTRQSTVRRVVADAILAVDGRPNHHQAIVLNIGCRRRLQGLGVLGFSGDVIGAELGMDRRQLWELRTQVRVTWKNHAAVRDVFDRLGVDGGSSATRTYALRAGWVHPLLWDDIDDPFEVPQVVAESGLPDPVAVERLVAGSPVHASSADKREAFGILLGRGWTVSGAAARVGINYQTAVRYSGEVAA